MRILLADDHPLVREGIKPLLLKLDAQAEIIEAMDYPSTFTAARNAGDLDLALLDLYMPGMSGHEGIKRFRATFPSVPLVILSACEQAEDIHALIAAGASGYIVKTSPGEIILNALRLVLCGGVYIPPKALDEGVDRRTRAPEPSGLTPRQLQVLKELARGKSNRQIAAALGLTEGTVKVYLVGIFRLLRVSSRTEAILAAQRLGLSPPGADASAQV
ncbi:MAG: response regulator transcription factor [Thiobacillaceae bacterium]|nr:response regulator transcription factor [Thiobacillaceae bacterium]MCX7672757.1 response regulator transcription factor [Thiobacillaceae bacterium]